MNRSYWGFDGDLDIWVCGVCEGGQGLTLDNCHNCWQGKRPAFRNGAQWRRYHREWKEWNKQYDLRSKK